MSFLQELKRRNVFRVGIAYVLLAWVLLQAADFGLDLIDAPNWVIQALVMLAVIGLPGVLVFSWVFEMTPEGLKREAEIDRSQSITPQTGRKLNYVITATLALVIVLLVAERQLYRPSDSDADVRQTTDRATSVSPAEDAKSVAVLPFADLSQAGDQAWFADGLAEEILNALAKTPDLLVTSRTASFRYRDSDLDLSKIADELGVAHILEGSVRSSGDRIRVTAQLIRASDGFHVWSETYDRAEEDVIAVQEDLAVKIANALETTMDPEALRAMADVGTSSVEAYQALLRGRAAYEKLSSEGDPALVMEALDWFERARSIDPGFAEAHFQVAIWWQGQLDATWIYSDATELSSEEMQENFGDAIALAIEHTTSPQDRLRYRAQEAEVNLRLSQAIQLFGEYLDERPQDWDAWNGFQQAAQKLSDEEALERARSFMREDGLRNPFSAVNFLAYGYNWINPNEVADYGIERLQQWPDDIGLLYQTHRAMVWAGRKAESVELLRAYERYADPSPLMRLRQACIEGRRSDAEDIFESFDQSPGGNQETTRWLMLKILGNDGEATDILRRFEQAHSTYELSAFLSYRIFDASSFPSLMRLLQRENATRPPLLEVPYRCPPPEQPSVGVLPFVNMSADPDNEYFSDGISEELLNLLVRIEGLRVPSRTSSFAFKGLNTDIKEIAEQLKVAHILEGSVRKAGNRVRVTAQLIDVDTDTHLWSETYDRELEDIFAIQDEIAGHIVNELKVVLGPEQAKERSGQPTANLSAYESYLRGRYLFMQRGVASLKQSVAAFRAAVEMDPDFSDAWAALAQAAVTLGGWDPAHAAEHTSQVEAAANRALGLDSESATALSALSMMHFNRLEWVQALEYMSEAARVARDSTPVYWYGLILQSVGYLAEAEKQLDAAERLDPVYPQLQFGLGLSALDRNDVTAARNHMQRAIDGNNANGPFGMSIVYLLEQDGDGLRSTIEYLDRVYEEGELQVTDADRQAVDDILAALDGTGDRTRGIAAAAQLGQISVLKWLGAEAEILGFLQDLLASGRHVELSTALGQSIWMPAFADVRRLPGFKPFLHEAGLVDLWQERGWPDLCRPTGPEGFECD